MGKSSSSAQWELYELPLGLKLLTVPGCWSNRVSVKGNRFFLTPGCPGEPGPLLPGPLV